MLCIYCSVAHVNFTDARHNLPVKLSGRRCERDGVGSKSHRDSVVKVLAGPADYL